MSTPTLEFNAVSRTFGENDTEVNALHDITFTVNPGELVAVMGPSGCGKTTLLNIAGTLDQPTNGHVTVAGQNLTNLSPNKRADLRRQHIGFVFQEYNLVPTLTVEENVALPLELDGEPVKKARAAARAVLDELGLASTRKRFPHTLSGGQQQRIAIARAIIGDRSLILADEPTGALDTSAGEDILNSIKERVQHGAAGLIVTHNSRHAAWADRVIFMRDGHIIDQSTPDSELSTELGDLL